MAISNSSSLSPIDGVAIPLASLSIIACIISLVVLIYFKLYRSFIYRLMLYSFLSLILVSLSTFAFIVVYMQVKDVTLIAYYIFNFLLAIPSLLATTVTLCICVLALCNHQFTYRADIVLLVLSLIFVVVMVFSYMAVPFLVNVVLTVLTLVPLCGRACGYNMCVKTIRTKESHRKTLKEMLPLLILPLLSYLLCISVILIILFHEEHIALLFSGALGLITALSFALHLFFIGKANLYKQKDGTGNEQSQTTEEEGTSETCSTEDQYTSEGEEDEQCILKNNQQ